MSKLRPGCLINDRYELLGELGQGGVAQVFACRHVRLERELAFKVVLEEFAHDDEIQARLYQEAQIMTQLNHPNLVPVYDCDEYEGRPYLVMRLLKGESLFETLDGGRVFTLAKALPLLIGALRGLDVAHQQGVVHKDLKPENLFLTSTVAGGRALVVTDFGVARQTQGGKRPLTSVSGLSGTPQYIAPEYALDQTVTPALDVYQMALVLIEMLTGESVVKGGFYQCIAQHIQGELSIPSWIERSVLGPTLLQGLSYEHTERFQSAGMFAQALERCLMELDSAETVSKRKRTPKETREARIFKKGPERLLAEAPTRVTPRAFSAVSPLDFTASELRGLVEGQHRVLLIDDDETIRELIRTVLASAGLEVVEASSGSEGLVKAFAMQPDLIVCDHQMPFVTGLEVIKSLRERVATRHIPIIMVTGVKSLDLKIEGLREGADDFITKPFQPLELIARVGAVLRRTNSDHTIDPVTLLPGNLAVSTHLSRLFSEKRATFVFGIAKLRDFDQYIKKVPFETTFAAVRRMGQLLYTAVVGGGQPGDFLGALAPHRYALTLNQGRAHEIGSRIVEEFDGLLSEFQGSRGSSSLLSPYHRAREPRMHLKLALLEVDPSQFEDQLTFAKNVQARFAGFFQGGSRFTNEMRWFEAERRH